MQISTKEELLELLNSITESKNETTPKEPYRYVLYVRKSTDDKDKQVRSLPDQISDCREYAEENKLNIVKTIAESESAKEPDIRPKFREMLDGFKTRKYDGLLAWHPDRLARNMKEAGELIDLIDKGVIKDLKFKSFSFENTPSGKMLLGITFVLSKHYSDHLSENVSRGNRKSIEEGSYINTPPHGYYKNAQQHLIPDGENYALIKKAFGLRVEGKTLDEIAEFLNEGGYSVPRKKGRKVYKMTKQRVSKFLDNPVYTGILWYGKNKPVDLTKLYDFKPMVSVEDFMKINELSNEKEFFKLARKHFKGGDVKANLMRDMVICSYCGETLTPCISKNRYKKNYFYYRCDTDDCIRYGKSIRANKITSYIYDYLTKYSFTSETAHEHFSEEMKRVSAQRLNQARHALNSFRSEKIKAEEKLEGIKAVLISDEDKSIKDSFKQDFQPTEDKIKELEQQIQKAEALIKNSKDTIPTYSRFIELMGKMAQIIRGTSKMEQKDFFIRKIFLNFVVDEEKVIESTLNKPFDALETPKVSDCAQGGT